MYILRIDGTDKLIIKFQEKADWNYENIQVDLRYSNENIEILDLSFQNNEISTDMYSKPSCHSENTPPKKADTIWPCCICQTYMHRQQSTHQ